MQAEHTLDPEPLHGCVKQPVLAREQALVRIGLLGCGTVGGAVAGRILGTSPSIPRQSRPELALTRVAVKHPRKPRFPDLSEIRVGDDALAVVIDPDIDVVAELIGGIEPARSLVLAALRDGKPVVTANKQLLARFGSEIFGYSEQVGVAVYFDAAVGGAMPAVRVLQELVTSDYIIGFRGVLNGTTNFILTEIERGCSFAESLSNARKFGWVEADATEDVDGHDAAAKLSILATLAFGVPVTVDEIVRSGITGVSEDRIRRAHLEDRPLRLVAHATRCDQGIQAEVGLEALEPDDPLARIRGATNGLVVETVGAGRLELLGMGAGAEPTATAVITDLNAAAMELTRWRPSATGF